MTEGAVEPIIDAGKRQARGADLAVGARALSSGEAKKCLGAGQTIEEHLRLTDKEKIVLGFAHERGAGDRLGNAALERVVQRSGHVAPRSLCTHGIHAMGEGPPYCRARAHDPREHGVDLLVALGAQTLLEHVAITRRNVSELRSAKVEDTVVG